MKTNFKIVSFTEITLEGIVCDLHNDFDFIINNLKIDEANILIHFKKSTGDWVRKEAPENIYFLVNDYNYIFDLSPKLKLRLKKTEKLDNEIIYFPIHFSTSSAEGL